MEAHKNHDKVAVNSAPPKPDVKVEIDGKEVMVSAQQAERLSAEAAKQAAFEAKRKAKAAEVAAMKAAHNAEHAPKGKPVAKG